LNTDGETINMTLEDEDLLPAINRTLVEAGAEVYAFTPQSVSLEELFLRVVGEEGEDL
jgi:hypothetical protein